jgi:hypothetical protein
MKQKIVLKDKILRKQINGKFNNTVSVDENRKNITIEISSPVRS